VVTVATRPQREGRFTARPLGYPILFSWISTLLIPITLAIYLGLRYWQVRFVFRRLGVRPVPDARGFLGYFVAYQAVTSTASLIGYTEYLTGSRRRWR
jgi:poly-beta-1,6-N-acetyl-D-glucosamine synthase